MVWKLATLVVAAVLIGAGILAERHRQFQAAHELAAAHRQIDHSRRELWQLQAELAQRLRPDVLTADLQQHGRPFGPVTSEPNDAGNPPLTALAAPSGDPTP
jgi:hypothetical protein